MLFTFFISLKKHVRKSNVIKQNQFVISYDEFIKQL